MSYVGLSEACLSLFLKLAVGVESVVPDNRINLSAFPSCLRNGRTGEWVFEIAQDPDNTPIRSLKLVILSFFCLRNFSISDY